MICDWKKQWVAVGVRAALFVGIAGGAGLVRAGENVLLQTDFEQGKDAPAGWTGKGSAIWSDFARSGKHALEIRTWVKDQDLKRIRAESDLAALQKTLPAEEYTRKVTEYWEKISPHTLPSETCWMSPVIEFSGKPVKVSYWGAADINWANDESFRAEVGIRMTDANGNLTGNMNSAIPLHFYVHDRTSYQIVTRSAPEGLLWEYREAVLKVPAGKGRIVFGFGKFPNGQAWMDDLVVSESADYKSEEERAAAGTAKKADRPWNLEINFPVSFNLFMLGDPLECDLAVLASNAPPAVAAGMKVACEIRDFNYRLLHTETVTVQAGQIKDYCQAPGAGSNDTTKLILLTLPESLKAHEGKTLFIRAKLMDGDKLMAEDEVTFGIAAPVERKPETLWKGCHAVANWQPGQDLNYDFGKKDREGYNIHAYKMGCQWNGAPVNAGQLRGILGITCYGCPSEYIPNPDSKPTFPAVERTFPEYGYYYENYLLQSFHRGADPYTFVPKWLKDAGAKKYGADKYPGYKAVFDVDIVGDLYAAVVQHWSKVFPNALVFNPSAGEVAQDKFRMDFHKAAYTAIKKVTDRPEVKIGAWIWSKENPVGEVLDAVKYMDIVGAELYGDPQIGMGADLVQATREISKLANRELMPTALEGCAKTGSERQIDLAKGVFDAHAHTFANGVRMFGQYEFITGHTQPDGSPILRNDLVNQYAGTGHSGGANRWKRTRYGQGGLSQDGKPLQYQMAISQMAYHLAVRQLDHAEFDRKMSVPEIWAFVFSRNNKGILFIETQRDYVDRQVEFRNCPSGFTALDIFGNQFRIEPQDGQCLMTISREPFLITFDKAIPKEFQVVPAPASEVKMLIPIVRKNKGAVEVTLDKGRKCELAMEFDPLMKTDKAMKPNADGKARIDITPLEERPTGKYRTYIRMTEGAKTVGLLSARLAFESSSLTAKLAGMPKTQTLKPALRVELQNGLEKPQKVKVRFMDRWLTPAARPEIVEKAAAIPALGSAAVEFEVDANLVKLNRDYPVSVEVAEESGAVKKVSGNVHFRSVPKAAKPIKVDGDLSDWELENLIALEPNWIWTMCGHQNTGPVKHYTPTWEEQSGSDGKFKMYLRWKDGSLYFAAVVKNSKHDHIEQIKQSKENVWAQDCMYLVMYAADFVPGEGTATFPHKMHLGIDENSKPILQDGRGVVFEDFSKIDCEYAVKETPDSYTYEFRMGPNYPGFRGLKMEPGKRFSISTMAWRDRGGFCSAFYRHFASFEGSIPDMGQFVVVEQDR